MRADIPDYPSSSPGRMLSIINFILGIWVLISPFVLGFSNFTAVLWNNIIVGAVIMIVSGTRVWARRRSPGISWINFVLGIWLIVSAFVFGFQMNPTLTWNQLIAGIAVAVVSAVSAMARRPVEPPVAP